MRKMVTMMAVALVIGAVALVWWRMPAKPCNDPDACRYDLEALKKTEATLLLKAGIRYLKPQSSNLTAVAVGRDDRLYVGSRTGVEVVDADGGPVMSFAVSSPVRCLGVAAEGEIFVGVKDHIEVYGRDGSRLAVWNSPGQGTELTSLAVASNFVFACDHVNRIVWRFTLAGELSGRVGDKDPDQRKAGFVVPSAFFDVVAASDGTVWIVSPGAHRVEHFTADGTYLGCWGQAGLEAAGFCGCCNPSNLALMPDGSFVTSEKHIVRVKVYDSAGRLKGIVSGQEDWPRDAVGLDLAVDSRGRILVLDPQSDVVRIYTLDQPQAKTMTANGPKS